MSIDWKAEYLKSVESGCITLDELREARAELDATNRQVEILSDALAESRREVAALKAVQEPPPECQTEAEKTAFAFGWWKALEAQRALERKAENARELGLDYEPADGTQVSKVWWDGEKLMAKPIPLEDLYQPVQDSTCNETLRAQGKAYPRTCRKCGKGPCIGAPKQALAAPTVQEPVPVFELQKSGWEIICDLDWIQTLPFGTKLYTTPPAAQRQWVGLTEDESDEIFNNWPTYNLDHFEFAQVAVAKVFEKNLTTKVTVPDALNPKDENPAYAAGWNDCRAEMLKGMK